MPLTRSDWRYTARPRWSSTGESMWMRLAKFSVFNRMGVAELSDLLSLRDAGGAGAGTGSASDLRHIGRWDQNTLADVLEISVDDVRDSFCTVIPSHSLARCATELRYCQQCLTMGFHAAWFQWPHIERCPLHSLPIRRGCLHCSSPIPYELGAGLALSPLCCPVCERDWVPALSCPRGQCVPLGSLADQLMQRWSEYVRQIITVEHHLGRNRSTGQFIATCPPAHATVAVRPHLLTMMNRLFDSPPPMPASGTNHSVHASGLTPPTWSANNATCAYRCPRFDRDHWPHFANDFIRYEHMVLAAYDQLFEIHGREFARERQHRLLLNGLLAPTNSIRRDTAAAVGWAVSWLGPSQALAPPTGFVAPSLGLTGWLTNLPLRTHHISVSAWNEQVARWLAEDLASSVCMWADVTEFMSTRGHYLLYGEAVHPVSLAIQRGAATD
jgi:hypothetical protein